MQIKLERTQAYNLWDPIARTTFFKQFIALLRFLASGHGNVRHLRLPGTAIHRELKIESEREKEKDNAPDWLVQESEQWLRDYEEEYES